MIVILISISLCLFAGRAAEPVRWKNGPPTDDAYFLIAVWLQDPRNADFAPYATRHYELPARR